MVITYVCVCDVGTGVCTGTCRRARVRTTTWMCVIMARDSVHTVMVGRALNGVHGKVM